MQEPAQAALLLTEGDFGHGTDRVAALELRVVAADRERGFADATRALQSFLKSKGLSSVEIRRSDLLPRPDPVSGKFKHIYREMG